jgi:aryl-alcohol dehydrogenase-like predicted oxidoreductase
MDSCTDSHYNATGKRPNKDAGAQPTGQARRGTEMRTVSLGNTGVEVSALCLGTMHLGSRTDRETSYRLLDGYVAAGGSFLDTANNYATWIPGYVGGESETLLGQWMRERRNRTRLFIATKMGFDYPGVERGLRAHQIETECEKSLRRLQIDTIDLYYAHRDDRHTPMEETLPAFDRLVKAGKVRFIGASNFVAWRLEEARWVSQTRGLAEYCCVQQRYSYLRPVPGADFGRQTAANDDLFDYVRARGIRMLAYTPLLAGSYARADRPVRPQYLGPDTDARLAALKAVCEEVGATPNQVVLAWMMQSDPAVIPIFGASAVDQLRENLGGLGVELATGQMARLNAASA